MDKIDLSGSSIVIGPVNRDYRRRATLAVSFDGAPSYRQFRAVRLFNEAFSSRPTGIMHAQLSR